MDEFSPLAASLLAARRSVLGLVVAVDGLCLGPLPAGTQIVVVETARALAQRDDVRQVVVYTPRVVPDYVRQAFAGLTKIPSASRSIRCEPRQREKAHVVYRPVPGPRRRRDRVAAQRRRSGGGQPARPDRLPRRRVLRPGPGLAQLPGPGQAGGVRGRRPDLPVRAFPRRRPQRGPAARGQAEQGHLLRHRAHRAGAGRRPPRRPGTERPSRFPALPGRVLPAQEPDVRAEDAEGTPGRAGLARWCWPVRIRRTVRRWPTRPPTWPSTRSWRRSW